MKVRAEALRSIEEKQPFDLCVIGGGATGAGCALDAQLRGLRTVLIEASDFAAGASGASTKIVHGGVRYLQQAVTRLDTRQYHVVKRALHERALMLANAPFLTRPLEFVIPCFSWWELAYYRLGMKIYDWMAGRAALVASRSVGPDEAIQRLRALRPDHLAGAVVYSDGQFDDCRYGIALVQTFVENGGEALNHAAVIGFEKDGPGKIVAAQVQDRITQQEFVVRAKAFVNATGAASDRVRNLAHPGITPRMSPSKGVHIVLPLDGFSEEAALLIPSTEDGRVIFAIPWCGKLLVGTTDDTTREGDELVVKKEEAEYLLRHLNRYLQRPFTPSQILGGSAGLRPLVRQGSRRETGKLVRDHEVELDQASRLISILGGKWTTYRAMAEDTINAVQQHLGGKVTPSLTQHFPLFGVKGASPNWDRLTAESGVSLETADHLTHKFGANASRILRLAQVQPELRALLVDGFPAIEAEVVYCIREEMAMTIEDVLARRIGMQLLSWGDSIRAAPAVGRILAMELGWSQNQTQESISAYVNQIRHFSCWIGD